jgi:RHS repeat-associated protein
VYSEAGLLFGRAYDSHHNLVERTDAWGGTTRFGYDALGRPVSRTDAEGHTTRVTRDALCRPLAIQHHAGRLREARLPDGRIARYRYDAFSRRVEKKLVPAERTEHARSLLIAVTTGTPPPPPVTTRFLYDGGVLCAELERTGQQGSASKTLTAQRVHVHLPGTLTPLLQVEGGVVYTVITDHLGAPRELIDAAGHVAWTAHFSAWGKLLEETREAGQREVRSPFRLLGQYHDDETGVCYTRFRYFDADTARWTTPDPLGWDGGWNLLAFDGSPVCQVDPWGLSCDGDGHDTSPSRNYDRPEVETKSGRAVRAQNATDGGVCTQRRYGNPSLAESS